MTRTNNSRGDTIVEVLIALAILASVLVGAYLTANKSQSTNRAAQERAEATKLVEAQLESLKGVLSGATPPAIPAGFFCLNATSSGFDSIVTATNLHAEPLDTATLPYSGTCGNIGGRYNVAIRKNAATYQISVRWDRAGSGRDQINMFYRTY